jgi:O-antigen ligase
MRWLLIGYMFLFIHRPFEIWPALGTIRIELLYMLALGTVWMVAPGKQLRLSSPLHLSFVLFAAAVLVCWLASPWMDAGTMAVDKYVKLLVFYVVLITIIRDERNLKYLVAALLVIMTLYMLHSLWEYHNGRHSYKMGIIRLVGVDQTLNDANAFGASILYTLPFVPAAWVALPSRPWRAFLVCYVVLVMGCIGLTGSRSAFAGFLLCALVSILRSRWRWPFLMAAVLSAPLLWAALPESLQNRFETIVNPEAGPKNAYGSAQGRLEGLLTGWELWQQSPFTGVGPGAWRPASGSKLEAHNLYGQVAGEMGLLGVAAFVLVVLFWWWNLRRINRLYREHPEWPRDFLYHLTRGLGLMLLLLLFEGNFGHNLYRYYWLWYGGFLIIARQCVEQRLRRLNTEEVRF